ncbi:tyrosinase [Lyophyllum atratum]|nr:tyrosinase [Lyophyllum atratum]
MSQNRLVIAGAAGNAHRLEINDFVKNEKFFSLYVQALQAMFSRDNNDRESFFQLGGIHGLPYVPWDGANGDTPPDSRTQWGGYCTHGTVLFPTWHRPYVMLYEQVMQKHAVEIAATYTVDRDAWKQAAIDIRQPYWDWAANAVPPPEVISLKEVTITKADGSKVSVPNPLYHYTFHPIDQSFPRPYSGWPATLRQPTSSRPNAIDNPQRLANVLRAAQSDITSSTYNMLTRVRTWTAFSSHTVDDGGSASNSIEAIHDGIHVNVGGIGQMSDPSVAAFDPIFFLHHCNVDRMLSLWSALNPGVWVSKGDSEDGSFVLPREIPVDVDTPLTPFWNAETTFWASAGTQDTAKLGYTYPEFDGLDMSDARAVRTAIGQIVNQRYGSSVFGGVFGTSTDGNAKMAQVAATGTEDGTAQNFAARGPALLSLSAQLGSADHVDHATTTSDYHEWTARVEFSKYELGCSFSVLLFLGEVPEDPEEWLISPNFVGAHHAFVNSASGECDNCRNQANIVVEGFVHLNSAIAEHSGLSSFDPAVIVPYLTQNLSWRIQKVDGTPAELESLEVTVIGTPLSYSPGELFPVPGDAHRYNGVTHGRSGGCRQA